MKALYKYHLRLYALYESFGNKPFYAGEGVKSLLSSYYIDSNSMFYAGLEKKKLIKVISKKEAKETVQSFNPRCTYRKVTKEGLEVVNDIENNKKLFTKYLLKIMAR